MKGDPLWEPEPELQLQPAVDTSVSEFAGSENADVKLVIARHDAGLLPQQEIRYDISDLTPEVPSAHQLCAKKAKTEAKPQLHKEGKGIPRPAQSAGCSENPAAAASRQNRDDACHILVGHRDGRGIERSVHNAMRL